MLVPFQLNGPKHRSPIGKVIPVIRRERNCGKKLERH